MGKKKKKNFGSIDIMTKEGLAHNYIIQPMIEVASSKRFSCAKVRRMRAV